MDKYIILFYCYLNNNCKSKYNLNKIYSQFFLNVYNDKNKKKNYKILVEQISKYCTLKNDFKNYRFKNIIVQTSETNNKFKYKYSIKYTYNKELKELIINNSILKSNIIYKSKKNIDTILLIYHILGLNSGQFWGLHPKVYTLFNNSVVECFASPFNHSIDNYYSLLTIDKEFGSKGNFFDNFINSQYDTYIINPPFTEYIILKVFKYIKLKLKKDKRNYCIFLYIPKWDDINIPFYNDCIKKYKIHKQDLKNSYVYDYINEKNIIATFDITLFLINDNSKEIFNEIIKIISN